MGHKTLADKLDQIQKEDLGIHFNETLLWEDLSVKLGNNKAVLIERRLLIAACITFLILLFPIVLMIDSRPMSMAIETPSSLEVVNDMEELNPIAMTLEKEKSVVKTSIHLVKKKGIEFSSVVPIDVYSIDMSPIQLLREEKIERQIFADQDISIIQASLGTPSIEKGKSITVRAQLHASSQPVQLNNQVLKIKLFEKSNQ